MCADSYYMATRTKITMHTYILHIITYIHIHASFGLIYPIRFRFHGRPFTKIFQCNTSVNLIRACIKPQCHMCTEYHNATISLVPLIKPCSRSQLSLPYAPVSCSLLVSPASLVAPIGGLQRRTSTECPLTRLSPTTSLQQYRAMLVPDPHVKTELVLSATAANQTRYWDCAPAARHTSKHRLDKRL